MTSTTTAASLTQLDIGPPRAGEEPAILDCMRECFGFDPEMRRWQHLYRDNPAGEALILLAREGKRVVSHAALVPRRIRAFGREGTVGQSVDAMTRPDWRRKGVKSTLAAELRRLADERGLMAILSFANAEHLPIVLKHEQRRAIRPFPVLVRPLKPVAAGLVIATRLLSSYVGQASDKPAIPDCAAAGPLPFEFGPARPASSGWLAPAFNERHVPLLTETEGIPAVAMVRDVAHLNWRYADAPGAPYLQQDRGDGQSVAATAVIRTVSLFGLRLVLVMEWLWRADGRELATRILQGVVQFGRDSGAHGVAALAMPGTLHRRLLRRHGFIGIPELLFPKANTLTVGPRKAGADPSCWFTPRNWYLTWGDGFML